jgi:hypothetical protein
MQEARILGLQRQVQSLNLDLQASQIREEPAIAMPHLARPPQTAAASGEKNPDRPAAAVALERRQAQHTRRLDGLWRILQPHKPSDGTMFTSGSNQVGR